MSFRSIAVFGTGSIGGATSDPLAACATSPTSTSYHGCVSMDELIQEIFCVVRRYYICYELPVSCVPLLYHTFGYFSTERLYKEAVSVLIRYPPGRRPKRTNYILRPSRVTLFSRAVCATQAALQCACAPTFAVRMMLPPYRWGDRTSYYELRWGLCCTELVNGRFNLKLLRCSFSFDFCGSAVI